MRSAEFPELGDNDAYAVLGVEASATPEEIKHAYWALMQRVHPDRGSQADPARALLANDAKDILTNPERRRAYDTYRRRHQMPLEPEPPVQQPPDPAGTPGTGPAGTPPGVRFEEVVDEWEPVQPWAPVDDFPAPPPPPAYARPPESAWSQAALRAFRFCLVPPIGFVLGIVALWEVERTGERGRGVATLAVVVSGIGMLALVTLLDGWL